MAHFGLPFLLRGIRRQDSEQFYEIEEDGADKSLEIEGAFGGPARWVFARNRTRMVWEKAFVTPVFKGLGRLVELWLIVSKFYRYQKG